MPPQRIPMVEAVPFIIGRMNVLKEERPVSIVPIAGASGSGKTTLSKKLVCPGVTMISIDDYYIGRQYSEENGYNFDQPESLDIDLLASHLRDLKEGKSIQRPIYSFTEDGGKRIGYQQVDPTPIIVVEGLFALDPRLVLYADLKIFVETSCHGRIVRRIMRDRERTTWDQREIFHYILAVVEPMCEKYVDSQKDVANIIVDNPYDPIGEPDKAGCFKEKQVKVELDRLYSTEEIQKAGSDYLVHTIQEDHYFVGSGQLAGEIVRIRREQGNLVFTYKGLVINDNLRVRSKLEFPISEQEQEKSVDLFKEDLTLVKMRDIFVLDGITFSLDRIFQEGEDRYFIEIRAKRIRDAKALLKKLGIRGELTRKSYHEIFSK